VIRALLAALCLVLAGCQPQRDADPLAARLEAGRRVWNGSCYFCHGYSGDARTVAADVLDPKPVDFTSAAAARLTRDDMLRAVREGRPGTAMQGFASRLSPDEIAAVTDFVRDEFMRKKAGNTRYHTAENGWPDHERYRAAFPFARGELTLAAAPESLTPEQAAGRRLFLGSCVSCHDGGAKREAPVWETRAVSFPLNVDACASCHAYSAALHDRAPPADATHGGKVKREDYVSGPYARHDKAPELVGATPLERRGEALFQKNCAFCHAADGTGKNWIGTFMEPHPRDLTDPQFRRAATRERLARAIRDGLPGTSMPAWKSVLPPADTEALVAYVRRGFGPYAE
jgi:cytochrome c oxidase cbb3-type subunit III